MRKATKTILVLVVAPLALASAYLQFTKAPAPPPDLKHRADVARQQASQAVDGLARQLAAEPNNPAGWATLGAAYGSMARWDDAAQAYSRVGPLLDGRADWLAAAAEVDFHRAGQRFTPVARDYIAKALVVDARHRQALTLAGSDATQREAWPEAIDFWQRLLAVLPANSADAEEVQRALMLARGKAGLDVPR